MDMYKIKWTRLQQEIFRLLCMKAGQTLNVRTIAKHLTVSPTAISNSLRELEKDRLIRIEKSSTVNELSITFNRDSENAINLKRVENLKMLYQSSLPIYLAESFPGCTIIMFGSYSFGEDVWIPAPQGHKSDIDIAIIGTMGKKIELEHFEKLLERQVNVNFYSTFQDIHKNLKSNIVSGIVLNGRVEL